MLFFKNYSRLLTLIIVGLIIGVLFLKYPAPHDRMLNIQNYLITVGGILSAFVISYLAGKIFNIRSERATRQLEIDRLADKITAFRKILTFTMKSPDFWKRLGDIKKFKERYPKMDYQRIRSQGDDPYVARFWKEEEISHSTVSLHLAMEAISSAGTDEANDWVFSRSVRFDYSIDQLRKIDEPCNQIWFYLDGRYPKYGADSFNNDGLSPLYKNSFAENVSEIDNKYRGKEFHRTVLADIGTEMYEVIIPKIMDLIVLNSGFPKGIFYTFQNLLYITLVGVIFPIVIQSLELSWRLDTILTLSCVWLAILAIINFILQFSKILKDEMQFPRVS